MSSSFYPGDIVVVIDAPSLTGAIGIVKGEGNVWDYNVVFPTLHNENFRLDPEQLRKIDLETLVKLASPVSPALLDFLV